MVMPIRDEALGEWYELLNRRVCFWVDRKRLLIVRGARAYRDRPHLIMEFETKDLIRRHASPISISHINSGATFSINPAPRGSDTFRRLADHLDGDPVVEVPWTRRSSTSLPSPSPRAGGAAPRGWRRTGGGPGDPVAAGTE